MSNYIPDSENICIKIDFERDSINPQRIFESMSHLISAIENFHSCLLSSIAAETNSKFLLADVREGSIESWLSPIIEGETNKEKSNRLIQFLNICTSKVIEFIEGKESLQSIEEINNLEEAISHEAKKLDLEEFPNVFSLDKYRLLKGFAELSEATTQLSKNDHAYLGAANSKNKINKHFYLNNEEIKKLLVAKTQTSTTTKVLVVKKPDFIGNSMWELIFDKTSVPVKIRDEEWLNKFHQQEEIVAPGDALRCELRTSVFYDKDNKEIDVKYDTENILGTVKNSIKQSEMDYE